MDDFMQKWPAATLAYELARAHAKLDAEQDTRSIPGRSLWLKTLQDEAARRAATETAS